MIVSRISFGCVVGCGVALAFGTTPLSAHAQPPLPPVVLRTSAFEIYAPDSASAAKAKAEIEYATAQFRRYFGHDPVKLAVILQDELSTSVDDVAFRARGFRSLSMPTDRALRGALPNAIPSAEPHPLDAEHRVLSHEACHEFAAGYAEQQRGGRPPKHLTLTSYGDPDLPDWFDEAVATLCESPSEAAARALTFQRPARIPLAELFTMTHPRVDPRRSSMSAVAAMAPGSDSSAKRARPRIEMKDGDGNSIPVDSATEAMIRRGVAGESTEGMVFQRRGAGEAPTAITRTRVVQGNALGESRVTLFYAEVQSVGLYLASRFGDRALGRIGDQLLAGRSMTEILTLLGGQSASVTDLDVAWQATLSAAAR